jgi:hypothetical protein
VREVLLDWVCRAHQLGDVTALAVRRAIPATVLLPVAAASGEPATCSHRSRRRGQDFRCTGYGPRIIFRHAAVSFSVGPRP